MARQLSQNPKAVYMRKKRRENKEYAERQRQIAKEWKRNNPLKYANTRTTEYRRNEAYLLRYGISLEQYNCMLEAQKGVCAICSNPPKTKSLHVDHNHSTGKVRGLLCYKCNRRLISRYTDPTIFRKAVEYLEREKALGL